MDGIVNLDEKSFNDFLISTTKPVLVDFWADWCGPCKMIAPLLEQISKEREDLVIAKVDVDLSPSIAQKYAIRGIPTMIIFKNGVVEATKVGANSKASISSWIDSVI
jgi:thioredoxin 1